MTPGGLPADSPAVPPTIASRRGFRCSLRDGAVLLLAGLGTWAGRQPLGGLVLLIPFVVLHFFLFCNVFRVGTRRELVWTALFLANFGILTTLEKPFWWSMGGQLAVTVVLIGQTIADSGYHGLGCDLAWLNRLCGRKPVESPDTSWGP